MKSRTFSVLLILVFLAAGGVNSDTSKDKEECTESLVGLATCLPYVGGNAPSPTPDCCNGLKQVLKSSKKCLCLLIKDRNDPQLGLSINLTLALGLPSACHAPSNILSVPLCSTCLPSHRMLKFSINLVMQVALLILPSLQKAVLQVRHKRVAVFVALEEHGWLWKLFFHFLD
nr:protein YLS3-like [Ipomoea trifida]